MTLSFSGARWLSVFGLLLCLFGPSTASAQTEAEEQARGHFRLGRAHYDNGDFLRAAQEFEAAFAISQHSQLLYNIYLAYRDANVTNKAAEALKGYLEQVEDVPNRAQLTARLQSLEQSLANEPQGGEQPAPTPAADPNVTAPTAEPVATPSDPAMTASTSGTSGGGKSKILPIVLMAAGGALIVGGVITGVMASGKASELEERCPTMRCAMGDQTGMDLQSSGTTLALLTDILIPVGVVSAGVGVVLFLLSGKKDAAAEPPPPATASVVCGPGMCGGAMRLSF